MNNTPPVVESFLHELLQGDGEQSVGLYEILDRCTQAIDNTRKWVAGIDSSKNNQLLDHARIVSNNFQKIRDNVQGQIDCIIRLRDDPEMVDVYSILKRELDDKQQWCQFLVAALRADYDYGRHRQTAKDGESISKEIVASAMELSDLIEQFQLLELDNKPPEFASVRSLLETTTNHSLLDVKVKRWEELRHLILGEKHPPAIPDFNNEKPSTIPPITDLYKEDFSRTINYFQDIVSQFDETQSDMQLAWSMAPNMPALLRTLAASAEKYKAEQTGMIGAIMDSQKKNRKTQHIRGFCYILIHDYNIHISPHLRKAIAVVSNVVLNDPDDSATAEDVRKALNKLIKYLRNIRRI